MKTLGLLLALLFCLPSCNRPEEEHELDQMVQIEEERTSDLAGPFEYEKPKKSSKETIVR